jgi:hypothetical protein
MRRRATLLGAALVLTACGQPAGDTGSPATSSPAAAPQLPADGDALVLRVTQTGGFAPAAGTDPAPLPLVSVYRDGRVLSQGPQIEIYPAPAWPNVQVNRVDEATLTELVQAAQDAGVTGTADLGAPSIADARTTSITLATAAGSSTRTVQALTEAVGDPALTAEQTAAREQLADLVDRLTGLSAGEAVGSYTPTAVAAFAGTAPAADPTADPSTPRDPVPWPGPTLPGEPAGPGIGCTVATGEQGAAVVSAAQAADAQTPWTDGTSTWSILFRPLLPDETGCRDLIG